MDRANAPAPELQPLRGLLNTLLDLGATLDDWEYLASPLEGAKADLTNALKSPVFDPIRREDGFLNEDADTA